ncbi:MAG TPA: purine-nucleoside phosphorylase [Longimicrobiales bacterium]|nr:purine-nucleoside phosphorylase [Longimicrobiales bacterium]
MSMTPDIAKAAALLGEKLSAAPAATLVLGSGLGHVVDAVEDPVTVPFVDLPGFPAAGVAGHAGRFVAGRLGGRYVLVQAGRYHVYEGHAEEVVAAPVRLSAALGVSTLLLTNAAGGVDPALEPGDLVLLDDHLNLMSWSPLFGPVAEGEVRFPDMTEPYDADLAALALAVAGELGIKLRRGVYAALTGPAYETAAEIRMLRTLGADVTGMSTVPEVLVARARGMRCMGLSMVTNKGTGLSAEPLSHADVIAVGRTAGQRVGALLEGVIRRLPARDHSVGKK